jgi:hypothetical protein
MQFRPNIADHDFQTKLRQIQKFLTKQIQVQIVVKMVGRENKHRDLALVILDKLEAGTKDLGKMDPNRRLDGNNFRTTISPYKPAALPTSTIAANIIKQQAVCGSDKQFKDFIKSQKPDAAQGT